MPESRCVAPAPAAAPAPCGAPSPATSGEPSDGSPPSAGGPGASTSAEAAPRWLPRVGTQSPVTIGRKTRVVPQRGHWRALCPRVVRKWPHPGQTARPRVARASLIGPVKTAPACERPMCPTIPRSDVEVALHHGQHRWPSGPTMRTAGPEAAGGGSAPALLEDDAAGPGCLASPARWARSPYLAAVRRWRPTPCAAAWPRAAGQ